MPTIGMWPIAMAVEGRAAARPAQQGIVDVDAAIELAEAACHTVEMGMRQVDGRTARMRR